MLKQIQERLGVLDALCAAPRRFPLRMSAIRKNNTGHNVVTVICYNTQLNTAGYCGRILDILIEHGFPKGDFDE
jgi:hypothetical protein